jgi:hypothetical protein
LHQQFIHQNNLIMFTTIEDLKTTVPAAFRTPELGAASGVSSKYSFTTTSEIIDILDGMGWHVHSAKQQKRRTDIDTAKHMLRFKNPAFDRSGLGEISPEVLLVNSHDRSSAIQFHLGLFRLICSNGLVVADSSLSKMSYRHLNLNFDEVKEGIATLVENVPNVLDSMERYDSIILGEQEQIEFVRKAMALRYPEFYFDTPELRDKKVLNKSLIDDSIVYDEILSAVRPGDEGNSLWKVYNRVQEKVIKGDFERIVATENGLRVRKARPIKNIRLDVNVNKGMWELLEQYN